MVTRERADLLRAAARQGEHRVVGMASAKIRSAGQWLPAIDFAGFPQRNGARRVYPNIKPRRNDMTTSSGHTSAILASRVKDTAVYNGQGERIGTVEDIVLDKLSNRIMFAALGFGGFLGMGEKYHPVPWSMLDYDEDKGGYVVPMNKDVLQNAPAYDLKDLTKHDGSMTGIRETSYDYYNIERDWQ